ncbi:MAG: helix-turn-helix domain-containing protein [Veillonellaceae bacterium]|nr:helix-turn-helix domain-containing protein [Veillonellaceae bacterium]
MQIGLKIKEARKEKGLTQKDFGLRIHKSAQVVSNWERGYTTGITPEDLSRISDVLGKPVSYFVDASPDLATHSPVPLDLTDAERAHLERYRQLTEENRKTVDNVTENALASQPSAKEKATSSSSTTTGEAAEQPA